MELGDIVVYQDRRWKVMKHVALQRTCYLKAFEGDQVEVPDDLDQGPQLKVLCNPAKTWRFATCPLSVKGGPIASILRGDTSLAPLVDWVPSDFLRPGGAVFFNPDLKLRKGEILAAVHKNGHKSRITITETFGTLQSRKRRASNPKKPQKVTTIDHLLGEDFE